ncbi:MAG: type II secretion system F family protein [Coriobacteriia bacterium]
MALAASVLVFLAVSTAAYSVFDLVFSEERRVTRRLRDLSDFEAEQARVVEPLLKPFAERVFRPLVDGFSALASLISPGDYRSRVDSRLTAAGRPGGVTADRFMAGKALLGFATFLLVVLSGLVGTLPLGRYVLLALILSPLAYFVPDLWLRAAVERRRDAIRRSLPDMLDMLTISVESGMGFDGAVAKLVRSSTGPLAEEFGRMLQEVQAGASRRDALKAMAERVDVPEMNTFIASVIQAEVFGISITKVLRTQAGEMRTKRRQYAEEMAQKAPVKIVFPLVLCILPATLLVIAGPAFIAIGQAFGFIP